MDINKEYEKTLTLNQLRVLKGFKKRDISSKLNLSDMGYYRKEKKQREFTLSEFKKLADLFEKSLDDMYKIVNN